MKNNLITKKYFLTSLFIHIFFIIFVSLLNTENKISKHFVVYGAHSKKPTFAFFKSGKTPAANKWLAHSTKKTNIKSATLKTKLQHKIIARATKVSNIRKSRIKNRVKLAQNNNQPLAIKKPVSKKLVQKPTAAATTMAKESEEKTLKNKKPAKKKPFLKKESCPKLPEPKEIEPEKISTPEKSPTPEKTIPQEILDQKEKLQQNIVPEKEEIIVLKNQLAEQIIEEKAPEEPTSEDELPDEEEIHFNLLGESDPKLERYQKCIQKEVERLWKPPVGVPRGTECTLSFLIDQDGNVYSFELTKRSKVLIYDLSVLRIAKNFKFDKSLWNKKFTIDFRQ